MPEINIKIEDSPDGSVKITSDPSFEEMMKTMKSSLEGEDGWHSSYDYAMLMLVAATKKSRTSGRKLKE